MKYAFLLLGLLFLFTSCQPSLSQLGPAADYYPADDLLRKGVVNKYYFHYTSADGYEQSTDIRYYAFRLLPDQQLETTGYQAGYEPTMRSQTYFSEGQQLLAHQEQYWRGDTFPVEIIAPQLLHWEGDTTYLSTKTFYNNGTEEVMTLRQTATQDTLIAGKPAKIFHQQRERHYHYQVREDKDYQTKIQDTYLQGIGLYERKMEFKEGKVKMELVEQMPWKTFLKRRAAVPERVAYINPVSTMDDGVNFKICDPKGYIHDYYNGHPDGGYVGGKRALQEVFSTQLDQALLDDVSGYLTFRFVINCEGQAGRFVTEEAGLDFKRMEFPAALVQHVYGIITKLTNWRAAVLNEEAIDTYAYLTLKFRDGQLIEILP